MASVDHIQGTDQTTEEVVNSVVDEAARLGVLRQGIERGVACGIPAGDSKAGVVLDFQVSEAASSGSQLPEQFVSLALDR